MPSLLDPVRLGALSLRNRFVMAPLTRCRADPGRVPNALMLEYYVQRASAGLIISEATAVTPMGVGYRDTPGIWTDAQVNGWRKITDAVHAKGGVMALQLWHVGRISDPIFLDGALPVAPSAIAPGGHVSQIRPEKPFVTPRALLTEELPVVVADYMNWRSHHAASRTHLGGERDARQQRNGSHPAHLGDQRRRQGRGRLAALGCQPVGRQITG